MVPAASRSIVGVTLREDDAELRELLAAIETRGGDRHCRTCPAGALGDSTVRDRRLCSTAAEWRTASLDWSPALMDRSAEAQPARRGDDASLAAKLGASLRADSPHDIFA
jgi:hydroxymethylbilane synthase